MRLRSNCLTLERYSRLRMKSYSKVKILLKNWKMSSEMLKLTKVIKMRSKNLKRVSKRAD